MNTTPALIMNIQRQPGANIIAVVDRVKALLPQLRASLPSAINISILTDRTNTIRASVEDVEFELMLTVALVVMVIFLFLRSLSATIIPSVAVPLSLVGTFGVMYLLGYSLNNLSLMALTISTGFVVDDAIVMIENISRYIEEGESPLQAALKGSEQIGFTIVSLTVSLIAVLIPLLFMGDIVGRLFREFAVTLARHDPGLGGRLADADADDVRQHPATQARSAAGPASTARPSASSNAVIERYGTTLRWVLRHQTATLSSPSARSALTIYLYIDRAERLLPGSGHRRDSGHFRRRRRRFPFRPWPSRQQELAHVILQDPAVESLSSFIGIDGTNTT